MATRADRQAAAADRRARVLQARLAGATFTDIGRQLGVTAQRAYQLHTDALRRTVQEPADQLRAVEAHRLDQLQAHAVEVLRARHVLVQAGRPVLDPASGDPYVDHGPVLAAISVLLRVAERRARLLGLDAPAKVDAQVRGEVHSLSAIDAELARLHAELATLDPPAEHPPAGTDGPGVSGMPEPRMLHGQREPDTPAPDVGGLVAGALQAALDAAAVPDHRREAAYTAAARLLAEAGQP
jgi:hypothetical protein